MGKQIWQDFSDGKFVSVFNEANTALVGNHIADVYHVSGLARLAQNDVVSGVARLKASLALCSMPQWHYNASTMALKASAIDDAIVFAQDGILQSPSNALLHFSLARALTANRLYTEAIESYTKAAELDDKIWSLATVNIGICRYRLDDAAGALACYDHALTRDPANQLAVFNRANILFENGCPDEAFDSLVVAELPDTPEVSLLKARILLKCGNMTDGWNFYRKRWELKNMPGKHLIEKPFAENLDQLVDKHVLLFHEQGFGDSIQFIRYLPMLVKRAHKVTLLVPAPLKRLFQCINDNVSVVETRKEVGEYDLEIPMLDLPYLFNTTIATIPPPLPLPALKLDIQHCVATDLLSKSLNVGLCWSGNYSTDPDHAVLERRRSIQFDSFATMFRNIPRVNLVSLQVGDAQKELPKGFPIQQPLVENSDFYDTACVMKQLDLVITVDTAVAHLAGALDVPVFVLSRYDGCWRWLQNREDSPWYKSMRLFHQKTPGNWDDPLISVMIELLQKLPNNDIFW